MSHSARLNSSGLLAYMKKVCRREKLAGLDISIFVQISLKTLSLLIAASQGVLLAWYDTDRDLWGSGMKKTRKHTLPET